MFALAERQLPVDPVYEAFLGTQAPDVLLISPLVHFGSAQADFVTAARARRIPVGMLLYSWDNLSTRLSGAGLDVRVERTPADGSARAARVP